MADWDGLRSGLEGAVTPPPLTALRERRKRRQQRRAIATTFAVVLVGSAGGLAALGNDPTHWWSLRSSYDISARQHFDVTVRRVGALDTPPVPSYTAVDARYGLEINRDVEAGLVLRNLLDARHAEWGTAPNRVEHERGVLVQVLWRL